jgi:hypothetical protein
MALFSCLPDRFSAAEPRGNGGMADAAVLKTVGGNPVRVRVPVSAPTLLASTCGFCDQAPAICRLRGRASAIPVAVTALARLRVQSAQTCQGCGEYHDIDYINLGIEIPFIPAR